MRKVVGLVGIEDSSNSELQSPAHTLSDPSENQSGQGFLGLDSILNVAKRPNSPKTGKHQLAWIVLLVDPDHALPICLQRGVCHTLMQQMQRETASGS